MVHVRRDSSGRSLCIADDNTCDQVARHGTGICYHHGNTHPRRRGTTSDVKTWQDAYRRLREVVEGYHRLVKRRLASSKDERKTKHLDHIVPFAVIVNTWMKSNGFGRDDLHWVNDSTLDSFRAFHFSVASYQLITPEEHAAKTAVDMVTISQLHL
jgi:hypothetical protein